MLKDEKIVVFADPKNKAVDGLPQMSIIFGDLKDIIPRQ
jgi:hypothetical protein